MRSHDYGRDILSTPKRKKVPEITAEPGLVVEDPASGFCGAVVKFEYGQVVLEDRHGRSSTIVTSQVPVEQWHEVIGSPTLADAILDRLVHNAHRIELKGESMRKMNSRRSPPAQDLDAKKRV